MFNVTETIAQPTSTDSPEQAAAVLETLTVPNLKAIATKLGLAYRSRDTKPALIASITGATPAPVETEVEAPEVDGPVGVDVDGVRVATTYRVDLVDQPDAELDAADELARLTRQHGDAMEAAYQDQIAAAEADPETLTVEEFEQQHAEADEPDAAALATAEHDPSDLAAGDAINVTSGKKPYLLILDTVETDEKGTTVTGRTYLVKVMDISPTARTVKLAGGDYTLVRPAGSDMTDEAMVRLVRPDRFVTATKTAKSPAKVKAPAGPVADNLASGTTTAGEVWTVARFGLDVVVTVNGHSDSDTWGDEATARKEFVEQVTGLVCEPVFANA